MFRFKSDSALRFRIVSYPLYGLTHTIVWVAKGGRLVVVIVIALTSV